MKKKIYTALAILFASTLLNASDGKIVLSGFSKENIGLIREELCSLSDDGKSCTIDTTKSGLKNFKNVVVFKPGVLKPDTMYVFKMKVEVGDKCDNDGYLHTIIRNVKIATDGIDDALRTNNYRDSGKIISEIKFKTPKNGGDYALHFVAHKGVFAKISDLTICEDDSLRFIPIAESRKPYIIDRKTLPRGAAEFDVDKPKNQGGEIVEAKKFGITPGKKNSIKDFNKAIEYCRKNGSAKLLFENEAVYRIEENGSINISGMTDFTFDGNGSTFVFLKKSGQNFDVKGNTRVKICNIKVDWDWEKDPLASLVRVESVNKSENYVDFKFIDYKKFPKSPEYVRCAQLSGWDAKNRCVGSEGMSPFHYDMFSGRFPRPKFKWLNGNTLRLYGNAYNKSAIPGALLRMQHYYYDINNMVMFDNKHITISDFTVLSCPGTAFFMGGKQKYTFFERVKIVAPDNDPKRVITCTADHFHVGSSNGYIKLDGCEFSLGADDCINFHDNTSYVTRKSENSVISRRPYGRIGDTVEFRNPDYSPLLFEAKIAGQKPTGSGRTEIFFDKPLPRAGHAKYVIFNKAHDTRNIIIRNSRFRGNRARGILILARDVTVENCRFERNEMGAIKLETGYTENIWCEGYGVDNVVVRNCSFKSCNQLGMGNWSYERDIFIGTYLRSDPSAEQTEYPVIKNVLFENNTFEDTYGMVAAIGSAQNVIFSYNTFINKTPRKNPREYRNGFFILSSSDIKIVNNRFEKSEFTPKLGVWFDNENTGGILVEGNRLIEKPQAPKM